MGTGLFLGVKQPGRVINHTHTHTPSSVEVKERVELYSSSVPSWQVVGVKGREKIQKNFKQKRGRS
jgi:ribosomal protein S16